MEKLKNDFKISFTKGDTYALAVKLKNITEDLRVACFTVKENPDDSPLIQKTLGAGIDKIDDREYKNEKTYKVQLQAFDTINLEANVQYLYDLQVTVGNIIKTVLSGIFVVSHSISGANAVTLQGLEVAVDDEIETEISTTPATKGVEYEQDPVACLKIGDMTVLTTTDKNSIVGAVNEIASKVSGNTEQLDNINKKTTDIEGDINGIFDGTKQVKSSLNSDNAIKNSNNTYSGFSKSEDGILKTENDIVPRKRPIYTPETLVGITNSGTDVVLTDVQLSKKTFKFLIKYLGGLYDLKMSPIIMTTQFATFHLNTEIKNVEEVAQIHNENITIMCDLFNGKFTLYFNSKYVNLQDFTIIENSSNDIKAELVAIYEVIE